MINDNAVDYVGAVTDANNDAGNSMSTMPLSIYIIKAMPSAIPHSPLRTTSTHTHTFLHIVPISTYSSELTTFSVVS